MIEIIHIHNHLGEGVYAALCDCTDGEFLINTRRSCPVNYNPETGMVRCPWGCNVQVALSVVLDNYANAKEQRKLSGFIEDEKLKYNTENVPIAHEITGEERK